ncbi:hypothetical protein BH10ACT2_BH10ACT2_25430 [soil metagenome]
MRLMSHDSQCAHSSRNGGRSIVRNSAVLALLIAVVACSGGDNSSPTTAGTVAATTPTTTIAATTTAPATTTTLAPTTTTSTIPVLDTSVLADVIAAAALGPVPEGTPIKNAAYDTSPLEDNGCHVGWGATTPSALPCEFGDTKSDVVIVITGDSHVAAWFGAFDEAGKANHWKIVTVTKRGCPTADVKVYSAVNRAILDAPYPQCTTWRANAIQYINDLHADLVVFPMLTRRGVVGHSGANAIAEWGAGLGRTLDAIGASGAKLLVISDTPKTNGDNIARCVNGHPLDIAPCGNKRSKAVLTERLAVLAETAPLHHATYVDTSNWFCTDTFCPAVIGGAVVYSDDSHLSDSYARYRAPQMAAAIQLALASNP